MRDLEFYNQGFQGAQGLRGVLVPFRRLLRRILRPIFQAQVELYRELFIRDDDLARRLAELDRLALGVRLEELEKRQETLEAREIEALALSRRLGAIEDRLFSRGSAPWGEAGHEPHAVPPPPHLLPEMQEPVRAGAARQTL